MTLISLTCVCSAVENIVQHCILVEVESVCNLSKSIRSTITVHVKEHVHSEFESLYDTFKYLVPINQTSTVPLQMLVALFRTRNACLVTKLRNNKPCSKDTKCSVKRMMKMVIDVFILRTERFGSINHEVFKHTITVP